MQSNLYPPVDGNTIKSGDQVFIATPMPPPSGENIPMQPMVVDSEPTSPGLFLLNGIHVFRLGICTVVFGSAILICGICCVAIFGPLDYNVASAGIWGGIFIIVAGALSIASGRQPYNRILNIWNLSFQAWAICNCVACLVLFSLNIDYFDNCWRSYYYWYTFYNRDCPAEKDEAVVVYSVMVALIIIQFGISIAVVVFCCRAFPGCRAGSCCQDCCQDCCAESTATHSFQQYQQKTFQTGYATMSPNVQPIPPGQILYMMTPVAVTAQHPQNTPAQIPQATLVVV